MVRQYWLGSRQVLVKRCPDTVDALAYQQMLKESLSFIKLRFEFITRDTHSIPFTSTSGQVASTYSFNKAAPHLTPPSVKQLNGGE
jgi:hypothetical protein